MSIPSPSHVPDIADLREEIALLFRAIDPARPPRIGIEMEWIPLRSDSGRPVPLGTGTDGLVSVLRAIAANAAWKERCTEDGMTSFHLPSGGAVSFEPGGQVEYSSPPFTGTLPLLDDLRSTARLLAEAAAHRGITLVECGIDPVNPVERAMLQIETVRYRRMARHFDRLGPAGRRMMRQTAALHVNLDFGPEPFLQWKVANALAPFLVAMFANSARYGGGASGFRNFRAQQWRELDPASHSSVGEDAVEGYLDYVLRAPALLMGGEEDAPRPFAEWVGRVSMDDWRRHLTMLFPEVRPRRYLEIRSCDALPCRWLAAPIVFLAGILCEREALTEVAELLRPPTFHAMEKAGRTGLGDPSLRAFAMDLFDIALAGAARLGDAIVDPAARSEAAEFRHHFTARGRDPAHECDGPRTTTMSSCPDGSDALPAVPVLLRRTC